MSGNPHANNEVFDTVRFTLGDFEIRDAQFYSPETDQVEQGYAVIWTVQPENVQNWCANIGMAHSALATNFQSVQMGNAFKEQLEQEQNTAGLLGDVVNNQTIH